jgi:hypothetical protein
MPLPTSRRPASSSRTPNTFATISPSRTSGPIVSTRPPASTGPRSTPATVARPRASTGSSHYLKASGRKPSPEEPGARRGADSDGTSRGPTARAQRYRTRTAAAGVCIAPAPRLTGHPVPISSANPAPCFLGDFGDVTLALERRATPTGAQFALGRGRSSGAARERTAHSDPLRDHAPGSVSRTGPRGPERQTEPEPSRC